MTFITGLQTTMHNSFSPAQHRTVHVLQIVSGDLWAGAEVMLYTLASTLHKKLNTRVSIVILNPGILEKKLRDCGLDVFVIDESMFNAIQILQQLNRIIDELQPDVIHTHRIKENILGSIAAWRNGHIPSLRTLHGAAEHHSPIYKLHKHIIPLLDWLCGRYYQRYIVAVSPNLAHKLEHTFPINRIKMIENGIDVNALTQARIKQAEIEEQPNTNGHFRIGIAGRLVTVKRVNLFIQSAIYFKQHYPEYTINFYIYGNGPLSNDLHAQVKAHQAEDYIHFAGHCDDILQQLQTMDALLMTSDHEGLPMILLEAMCMKVPIIAHAVGGIPHLLDESKCGVLVHKHQPKDFAEAIFQLISHPEENQKRIQAAFERVNQYYSAHQTAEYYLQLYNQLANTK